MGYWKKEEFEALGKSAQVLEVDSVRLHQALNAGGICGGKLQSRSCSCFRADINCLRACVPWSLYGGLKQQNLIVLRLLSRFCGNRQSK